MRSDRGPFGRLCFNLRVLCFRPAVTGVTALLRRRYIAAPHTPSDSYFCHGRLFPVHHRVPSAQHRPQETPTPRHLLRQLVRFLSSSPIPLLTLLSKVVSKRLNVSSHPQRQSARPARLLKSLVASRIGRGILLSGVELSLAQTQPLHTLLIRGEFPPPHRLPLFIVNNSRTHSRGSLDAFSSSGSSSPSLSSNTHLRSMSHSPKEPSGLVSPDIDSHRYSPYAESRRQSDYSRCIYPHPIVPCSKC